MAKVPVLAARIFRNVFMEGKHAGMPCFRSDRELDFCTLLCLQWLLVCQIPSDPSLDWAGNYAQMLGQVAKSIQSLACDFLNFLSPSHSLRFTNPLFSCWLKPLLMLGMKFTTERIRTDMPYFIFWLKSRDVTIVIIVHFRDQMSLKKHILYLRPKPWSWMHGMHETWPYAGHPRSTSGLSWKKHACFSLTFSFNTGWFFGRTIGFIEETQVCCRVFCICHSFGGLGRKYTRCQMIICSMHWLEFIDWHVMNLDIQTPLCIPALVACRSRIVSNWASVPSSQAPWSGKSQRWNSEWHNVRFGFGVWLSIVMIVYDCAMWWVSWSFFKFLPCSLWFQARTPSNFRRCAPTWAQPKLLQVSGGMESEQMVAVSRLAWYSLMAISSTQIWRIETFDFCEPFLLSPPKHSSFLSR